MKYIVGILLLAVVLVAVSRSFFHSVHRVKHCRHNVTIIARSLCYCFLDLTFVNVDFYDLSKLIAYLLQQARPKSDL